MTMKEMEGGKKSKKSTQQKKSNGSVSPKTKGETKGLTMAQLLNLQQNKRKKGYAGSENGSASSSGSVRSFYSAAGTTRVLKKVKRTPGKKGTKK